jgi:hypothetical protein
MANGIMDNGMSSAQRRGFGSRFGFSKQQAAHRTSPGAHYHALDLTSC